MKKTTRRALFLSFASMFLCFTMLLGTTYAWFTDSVESGVNQIVAGNLDVELYNGDTKITGADTDPEFFNDVEKWEPGAMAWETFTVKNVGDLALKYTLEFIAIEPTSGVSLAKALKIAVTDKVLADPTTRIDPADYTWQSFESFEFEEGKLNEGENGVHTVIVWWEPTNDDNDYNMNNGKAGKASIDFKLKLFATQLEAESDSFGTDYDADAPVLTVKATPETIQEILNGQHGSLTNKKIVLTAGEYGQLVIGAPTKYAGSNTTMYCETHDFTTTDAEEFKSHLGDGQWHATPQYTTTIENLTITAEDGVIVDGVIITSGHVVGPATDLVLDKDVAAGSTYYLTNDIKGLTFENVTFIDTVNINTSEANTVIDGVKFENCNFTTNPVTTFSTATNTDPALRFYNEVNNGNLRNITVVGCTFDDCFQGVYTHHIKGIVIEDNTFNNTVHNAIAIQSHGNETVNYGNVSIKNNKFTAIGDRVIRFGNVGAGSDITIEYNIAKNSGDEDGEVIKAVSIADGVKTTVNYNSWGGTVVNPQFDDVKTAEFAGSASDFKDAATNSESKDILLTGDINVEDLTYVNFTADTVVNGNGNSLVRDTASGNPLLVNTTNKVTFDNIVFESTKGSAVLATRKAGANIEVNNCVFKNNAAPSTGNTGIQVYANDVTFTFNNCTFDNMPIETNSSYSKGIKLVFNNCTFNWTGDNCPGFIKIANNVEITVDINNCKMNYTTSSQYTTSKNMISYSNPGASTININGLKVTGTRNNDKIWRICSNNKITINTAGELSYTFNGEAIDFATYLK